VWRIGGLFALALVVGTGARGADKELARTLFEMVKPLLKEGKTDEAIPYLEKVMKSDPEFCPAIIAAARIHAQKPDKESQEKAAALYARAKELLEAKPGRTPEEETDLREATQKVLAAKGDAGEFEKLQFEQVDRLRRKAAELEEKKQDYSALRVINALLAIDPKDEAAQKARQRLADKVGPVLAAAACGGGAWEELWDGKDLKNWLVYSGEWEIASGLLRQSKGGSLMLFYNGPPRRNFVVQVEARFSWGSECHVLGRADRSGTGYRFGLQLRRQINWETKEVLKDEPTVSGGCYKHWDHVRGLGWQCPPEKFHFGPGQWYTIELECRDKHITCRVNGQVVFEQDDEIAEEGTIGLRANGGLDDQYVDIRRIRVKNLP